MLIIRNILQSKKYLAAAVKKQFRNYIVPQFKFVKIKKVSSLPQGIRKKFYCNKPVAEIDLFEVLDCRCMETCTIHLFLYSDAQNMYRSTLL